MHPYGVTPRDVYRSVKAIARRARELGRSVAAYTIDLMTQLAQMGKGTISKNGRTVRFVASVVSPDANPLERNLTSQDFMNPSVILAPTVDLQKTNHSLTSTVGGDGLSLSEPFVKCVTPPRKKSDSFGQSSTTQMLYSTNELIQQDCPTLSGLYVPHIDAGIPIDVTEVTEAVSQSEPAIKPSPLTELSPVTEHFTTPPLKASDPPLSENHSELASKIPDEHRELVADAINWIEQSLLDGVSPLGYLWR